MLEPYVWLKWLHVLSSAVLLGVSLGGAFHFVSAHRSRKLQAVIVVARSMVKADWRLVLPAAVVQLLSGLGLVIVTRTPIDRPWLLASYGLYLVAIGCWWAAVGERIRAKELAQEASTGAPMRSGYRGALKRWHVRMWPALGALVLIFLLMIAKPQFW